MMWNSNTIFVNSKQQYYQKLGGIVMKEMSLNLDHLNDTCRKVQNHILASITTTTLTLWISAQKRSTLLLTKHYDARYYKEGIKDWIPERWSKEIRHYHFEALNGDPMIKSMNLAMQIYLDSENLIDMLSKNKLGSGNKRLKGRDWTDYDVKSLKEMLKKIDAILKHREQLRRLEEYVGGRPKTINPRTFIRPLQSSLKGRLLETQKSVDYMAIYLSLIV
ncbi:hypothetical protein Tco_0812128 [Tanacetum coccineum]